MSVQDDWGELFPLSAARDGVTCCKDWTSCSRCGARSRCVSHESVHNGVGRQTFDHLYLCPVHGEFSENGVFLEDGLRGSPCHDCALREITFEAIEARAAQMLDAERKAVVDAQGRYDALRAVLRELFRRAVVRQKSPQNDFYDANAMPRIGPPRLRVDVEFRIDQGDERWLDLLPPEVRRIFE